jgi:hypothetical protein
MKLTTIILAAFIAMAGCASDIPADTGPSEAEKTEALSIVCDDWALVLEDDFLNLYNVSWHVFDRDGDYAYIYYAVALKVPGGARYTYASDTWAVFAWINDEWVLLSSEVL